MMNLGQLKSKIIEVIICLCISLSSSQQLCVCMPAVSASRCLCPILSLPHFLCYSLSLPHTVSASHCLCLFVHLSRSPIARRLACSVNVCMSLSRCLCISRFVVWLCAQVCCTQWLSSLARCCFMNQPSAPMAGRNRSRVSIIPVYLRTTGRWTGISLPQMQLSQFQVTGSIIGPKPIF